MRANLIKLAATISMGSLFSTAFPQNICDYSLRPAQKLMSSNDVKARYANLIFRIFAGDEQGTAFAIEPRTGYFLTAQHVVADLKGKELYGDLESQPNRRFRFVVVKGLCLDQQILDHGRCTDDRGDDTNSGVDVALLKMNPEDLAVYNSETIAQQDLWDISLSAQPPVKALKAGYPKGFSNIPPVLIPSDPIVVNKDPGDQDHLRHHRVWKLNANAPKGESGSPVMDVNGNVVAILTEQDPSDGNKGFAVSLLEAMELLKLVFAEMPKSQVARRLSENIAQNTYKSRDDVAHDLSPTLISNKELSAVILEVTAHGSPQFRYKHCPVDLALNDRDLDGIYGAWEQDDSTADLDQKKISLIRDANGLLASGQSLAAAQRYGEVVALSESSKSTDAVTLEAALQRARLSENLDLGANAKALDDAVKVAYQQNSKEAVSLATSYRFSAQLAAGLTDSAIRSAKQSFVQAPEVVYSQLRTAKEREDFRLSASKKLDAEGWQNYMAIQQTALETRLLDKTDESEVSGEHNHIKSAKAAKRKYLAAHE